MAVIFVLKMTQKKKLYFSMNKKLTKTVHLFSTYCTRCLRQLAIGAVWKDMQRGEDIFIAFDFFFLDSAAGEKFQVLMSHFSNFFQRVVFQNFIFFQGFFFAFVNLQCQKQEGRKKPTLLPRRWLKMVAEILNYFLGYSFLLFVCLFLLFFLT